MRIDPIVLAALARALAEANGLVLRPSDAAEPKWIRPPLQSEGPCPYTALKHASFYSAFVDNPRIRQARMGTGKDRGTRLLWLPDVYAEIERISNEQRASQDTEKIKEHG